MCPMMRTRSSAAPKQPRARVLRSRLVSDLPGRLELAVADEAARVNDAFGDPFTIEVTDLLEEVVVLHGGRPAAAHRALRLIVRHGVALTCRQRPIRPRLLVVFFAIVVLHLLREAFVPRRASALTRAYADAPGRRPE